MAGKRPSCSQCLRIVKIPVNAAIQPAEPVFFRHLGQAGPVPGDPFELWPNHLIGRTAGERNVVTSQEQRKQFCCRGTERGMPRRVGGKLRG